MKERELEVAEQRRNTELARQHTISADTFGFSSPKSHFHPAIPTDYSPPPQTAKDLEFAMILAAKNAEIERWNN